MSGYCEAQDFERLKKATALLRPVTSALAREDANLALDLGKAITGKDSAAALLVVHRMAWADLRELFDVAEKNADGEASRHIKAAFLDYTVISPALRDKSSATDQHIKVMFKRASAAELPAAERRSLLADIAASASKAYPVLK